MNCYNHQNNYAVGICKRCFKGLCQNCCYAGSESIVCSEKCAEKCNELEAIEDKAKVIYGVNNKTLKRTLPLLSVFLVTIGLVFVFSSFFNVYYYKQLYDAFNIMWLFIGGFFILFGVLYWRRSIKSGLII